MNQLPSSHEEQASTCLKEAVALRPELLRYARKLTNGDDETARELVQEATLRLHEGVQRRGTPSGQLKHRLLAIMRNVHIDEQRRASKSLSIEITSTDDGEPLEHAALQRHGQQLQADSQASDQAAHLADLANQELRNRFGPAERILFRLSVEGINTRDISEMTGFPHSTACRHIRKIKEYLQSFLRPLVGIV